MRKLDRFLHFIFRTGLGRTIFGMALACVAVFGGVACSCNGCNNGTCAVSDCGGCNYIVCGSGNCMTDCGGCVTTCGGDNCSDCMEYNPLCAACGSVCSACGGSSSKSSGCYTSCLGFACDEKAKMNVSHTIELTVEYYHAETGAKLGNDTKSVNGDSVTLKYANKYEITKIECGSGVDTYFGNETEIDYRIPVADGDYKFDGYSGGHKTGYTLKYVANRSAKVFVRERYYGKEFSIQFVYPEKMNVPDKTVTAVQGGAMPEFPDAPAYDLYPFEGWKNSRGNIVSDKKIFNVYDYVSEDSESVGSIVYIYARYEVTPYNVTVYKNTDGYVTEIDTLQEDAGTKMEDVVAELKSKYGLGKDTGKEQFLRWSFNEDGTDVYFGSEIIDKNFNGTLNIALYANYHKTYKEIVPIVLHNVEGPGSGTLRVNEYREDDTPDLSSHIDEEVGRYKLSGWYTDSSLQTPWSGEALSLYGNHDFYAKWTERTKFTVQYYYSLAEYLEGKSNGDINDDTLDYYQKYTLKQAAVKDKFTFKGWNILSADGKTVESTLYTDSIPAQTVDRDIKLIAVYEHTLRIVINDADGALPQGQSKEVTVLFGRKATLPIPASKNPAKTFDCYADESGNALTDSSGNLLRAFTADNVTGDPTRVVAKWKDAVLTVSFTANGKTLATRTVTYGHAVTPPAAPAEKGHDFVGWTLNGVDVTDFSNITQNATYAAKYAPRTYTVTLQFGNGEADQTKQITYGSGKGTQLPVPTKAGKTFLGWRDASGKYYTDEDGILNENYMSDGDIVLIAHWA